MAGESYTSPVTGETYTVPKYTDPADAPIAFKDFADTITGGGGIDIPATRVDAVVQTLNGTSWVEGMALSVSDTVPADTEGQVGDVVFISGLPDGLPVGGGKVIEANSSNAALRVTQTGTGYALLVEDSANPDATPFVVNAAGNVGIGTSSPSGLLHVEADGTNDNFFVRNSDNTGASSLIFRKRRGTSGSAVIVNSGDNIGNINFQGYDGSNMRQAALIVAQVDGTPGADDMPGRLSFQTTPSGSSTATERMRINNAGLITGTGPSLGAWTAYTPTVGGTGWALGNGTVVGAYCQIGKVVHYRISIEAGSSTTFGSLTYTYPLSSRSVSNMSHHSILARDVSTGVYYALAWKPYNSTTGSVAATGGTNGALSSTSATDPFTWQSGDTIFIAGTYEAV